MFRFVTRCSCLFMIMLCIKQLQNGKILIWFLLLFTNWSLANMFILQAQSIPKYVFLQNTWLFNLWLPSIKPTKLYKLIVCHYYQCLIGKLIYCCPSLSGTKGQSKQGFLQIKDHKWHIWIAQFDIILNGNPYKCLIPTSRFSFKQEREIIHITTMVLISFCVATNSVFMFPNQFLILILHQWPNTGIFLIWAGQQLRMYNSYPVCFAHTELV